jgi:beta-galactosidase
MREWSMADGRWLMGKRALLTSFVLLLVGATVYAEPGFIVLPGMDRVQVKLTATSAYQPGAGVSYEIRHWPDGEPLSQGTVEAGQIKPDASGLNAFEITGLRPILWSPQDPQLYEIEIRGVGKARFGFRVFETKDRKFYLNGRPLFLRAMPIDPPGRDLPDATGKDPEFMRGYLRLLKSAHVNLIRTDTQEWLDACDEIGMMTFQGDYGGIPGNVKGVPPPFEQAQTAYRNIVVSLANHPCVVIYVLTNEILYRQYTESQEFLERIRADLRLLDPTRPVIGNAGFGRGKPGEIFDVHPYWGYYSGNLCDWYRLSEYQAPADEAGQPLTLSECVGAYTSDAGTFLTMSKQLSTMV